MLTLAVIHTSINPILQYQRSAIEHWHLWRLFSAHAVHLNVVHALLNITALWLIIFWLGAERSRLAWLSAGALIGLGISLALYLWQPNISYYVGLSGVLHGLLVFGLVPLCWKNQPAAWVGFIAVIIKLCYEQIIPTGNNATEALIAGPVVSIAHIYGACSGLLLALIGQLKEKIQCRFARH
ncbi:rhombosortase [Gilvimarinus polysaccharolyticus]|uniref:rhombosortase n=1 Tax=Gilvimarinus polysaccharolyticus TaxID=863921 RepID=UPI00067364FB|nr:rhombosortase [Gilvimarinus polysaccharolyticus]